MKSIRWEGAPIIAGGVAALSALVIAHEINKPDTFNPTSKAAPRYESFLLPSNKQLDYLQDGTAQLKKIDPRTDTIATLAIYDCEGYGRADLMVTYPQHHDSNSYTDNSHCIEGKLDPSTGQDLPGMNLH